MTNWKEQLNQWNVGDDVAIDSTPKEIETFISTEIIEKLIDEIPDESPDGSWTKSASEILKQQLRTNWR